MEFSQTGSSRRKSKKKAPMENYYKVLGTTAKASEKTIRERYITKVREFPPETHPEEFQKVRLAYDTLKDPKKRQEYDLQRTHGGRLERLIKKAKKHIQEGEQDKAKALLSKALSLAPGKLELHYALGSIYLDEEEYEGFEHQFSEAYKVAPENYKAKVLANKAEVALDCDEEEMALEILENLQALHPEEAEEFAHLLRRAYMDLDMGEELWELAQAKVNELPLDALEASHWPRYLHWLNALTFTENWSLKSKVMSRVRKYLKNVILSQEEEARVVADLRNFSEEAMAYGDYKEASVFLELLKYMQPKDSHVISLMSRFQKEKQLDEEVNRLNKDPYIFPLVRVEAMKMYLLNNFPEKLLSFVMSVPPNLEEMYGSDDEEFAYGLALLKKKYKGVYREYQEKWDRLFEEKQGNLNREARRSIKY